MFWNKKNTVEFAGLPVVLSIRNALNFRTGIIAKQFLAYKTNDGWKGLVGYEQFREEVDEVNKKVDLILKHLNLEYVRETKKREPAKLVERDTFIAPPAWGLIGLSSTDTSYPEYKPKKKKGRPKKK